MHIAITGASGFIGQNFIKQNSSLKITEIDLLTQKVEELDFEDVDVVLNLAAIVHRPDIKEEKIYDDVNHKLAINIAKKAKLGGVSLFIQMSTIAIYGNNDNIAFETRCIPQNPYALSKLKADNALLLMQDEIFKVAIVRPPMIYGGGKAPGNMMRLIKLADKGFPLPFKGLNNSRDFIHIYNLIQYLTIIAKKRLNGIHLISDNEPVSTEYLLTIISKYLGSKVTLVKMPKWMLKVLIKLRPREYEKLFGSSHITTNFPFEEDIKRYGVEQGIAEMVAWYKNNQ